jgi:hypothetical protein
MNNIKAIFLNCTLKKSPAQSNTDALIQKAVDEYKKMGIESKRIISGFSPETWVKNFLQLVAQISSK